MNAVWLNDELMVSPALVAGLLCGWAKTDWYVNIYLTNGEIRGGWRGPTKAAAEAEMARLSELLWPNPPEPTISEIVRTSIPDIRIYDPELYGLPVCEATFSDGPTDTIEHCNLADGHPGDHRWGMTFSEAHPAVPCGSMSNAGYRCNQTYGHQLPHTSSEFGREQQWWQSDHV